LVPLFTDSRLRALSDLLREAVTGPEISALFARLKITDVQPAASKRDRLYEALAVRQTRDQHSTAVAAFIQACMDPVRFSGNRESFDGLRARLNEVLAFSGVAIGEDGALREVGVARTLSEAQGRAERLQHELRRRGVHADVLRLCRAELLEENYFHAVLEATKSVAEKLRQLTGLTSDGPELVDAALGRGQGLPMLAFNTLQSVSEQSEHTGLMNLLKGLFGAFRNPTAHSPRVSWAIQESDAMDLLTLASLLHRRLDAAVRTNPKP